MNYTNGTLNAAAHERHAGPHYPVTMRMVVNGAERTLNCTERDVVPNYRCVYPGLSVEMAKMVEVASAGRIKVQLVRRDSSWTFQTIKEHLAAGSADCVSELISYSVERAQIYERPVPITSVSTAFAYADAPHNTLWLSAVTMMKPFQANMWLASMLMYLITVVSTLAMYKIAYGCATSALPYWNVIRQVLPHACAPREPKPCGTGVAAPHRREMPAAIRASLRLTFVTAFVVCTLYQRLVLASLLRPPAERPAIDDFGKLADAIENGSYRLLDTSDDQYLPVMIRTGTSPELVRLRKVLQSHPYVYVPDINKMKRKLKEGGYIYCLHSVSIAYMANVNDTNCTLRAVYPVEGYSNPVSFVCRKGMAHIGLLNEVINNGRGRLQAIVDKYHFYDDRRGIVTCAPQGDFKVLSAADVAGPLMVWLAGLLLAGAVYAAEACRHKWDALSARLFMCVAA